MSFKRARPPAQLSADGASAGLVVPEEPLPFIPPLHATLALLVRAPLPAGGARALLARLAAADAAAAQAPAATAAAAARLGSAYASSRALEAARGEAAARLEADAALHARRAGEAAALAAGAGGGGEEGPQQPLSRDAAAAAAEAAAAALREYGLLSASARAVAVVQHGSEGSGGSGGGGGAQLQLPPPALAGDPARLYAGRPLRGATSGAAYLAAEREAGAPPPQREAWRYPIDASAASGALDPHLVLGAREVLRRPCWPDRLHPRLLASGGAAHARGLALAAQYDAAAEEGAAIAALEVRALQALARQGGGGGGGAVPS
jgi:hypothetical protein